MKEASRQERYLDIFQLNNQFHETLYAQCDNGQLGAVEEASADEVERVYRTNVFGPLNVTRAILPHMRSRRSGRILTAAHWATQKAGTAVLR
jgi:NAD(P)-dependent dehydrogenase (short-subunit alcohol dehydrogenase family)